MSEIEIVRSGPLTTIQDAGRLGMLAHGISASGPMDRSAYHRSGQLAGPHAGSAIEFSSVGLCIRYRGEGCHAGAAGGVFKASLNGDRIDWPATLMLKDGDTLDIATGPQGNFGYLRFGREIEVPLVLGSRSTNATVGLGGLEGRALVAGDRFSLGEISGGGGLVAQAVERNEGVEGEIRVIWGIHAQVFSADVRTTFCAGRFVATSQMNRMGMRLKDTDGVFARERILSLVSDAVVPGDIQILGDGSPIVLLRDHQPTGGYPRIATIIDADLDRFAQIRPGTALRFVPVTVDTAHKVGRTR